MNSICIKHKSWRCFMMLWDGIYTVFVAYYGIFPFIHNVHRFSSIIKEKRAFVMRLCFRNRPCMGVCVCVSVQSNEKHNHKGNVMQFLSCLCLCVCVCQGSIKLNFISENKKNFHKIFTLMYKEKIIFDIIENVRLKLFSGSS